MVLHICEKCKKEFTKKSNYTTHINKKMPCDKKSSQSINITPENTNITPKNTKKIFKSQTNNQKTCTDSDLTCKYCLLVFCRKDVLKKHFGRCKIKKQDDVEKKTIFQQLIDKDELIKQLVEQNKVIVENNKTIVENNKVIADKYDKLLKKTKKNKKSVKNVKNVQNIQNIQNNTNNIQNNTNIIQIIQFGKENLDNIDRKHYLKILSDIKVSGYKFFTEVIKSIHFNPVYPEFQNIYLSDINREKCMIFDGKNWKLSYLPNENHIIPEIIDKTINYSYENNDILKKTHKDNEFIQNRIKTSTKYLEKCDNENLQDMIDEDNENPSNENKKNIKNNKKFQNLVEDEVKLLLYNEKCIVLQKIEKHK